MTRSVVSAAAFVLIAAVATGAEAGTCPADKTLTTPRELEQIKPAGLAREVLANVRLEGWRDVGGYLLRMRRLEVQPGGFIPTHEHSDRPSIVYVVKGQVIEHSSFCSVPILHVAGDSTAEFGVGHAHWWENKSNEVVTFISTDVVPFTGDAEPYVGLEN